MTSRNRKPQGWRSLTAAWFRIGLHALPAWRPLRVCSAWWLVDAPCRLGDVYGWDALSLLMDAGWALTVIRILLAVFFVMVLNQPCLHVCMSPLTWVESWHAEVLRIRLIPARLPAMARRIRPRLSDAWMWTSHEGAFLPLLFPVWHMHDNLMWFQGDRCQAYIIAPSSEHDHE